MAERPPVDEMNAADVATLLAENRALVRRVAELLAAGRELERQLADVRGELAECRAAS